MIFYTFIKYNIFYNINKSVKFYFNNIAIYFNNIIRYFDNNRYNKYLILIIINYYFEIKIFKRIDIDKKDLVKVEIN